jgi:hypothetical protein
MLRHNISPYTIMLLNSLILTHLMAPPFAKSSDATALHKTKPS